MIPDWLYHAFAFLGALHVFLLTGLIVWLCWTIVDAHIRAVRFRRKLLAALKADRSDRERRKAQQEAYMADEWVIREVAERMEKAS